MAEVLEYDSGLVVHDPAHTVGGKGFDSIDITFFYHVPVAGLYIREKDAAVEVIWGELVARQVLDGSESHALDGLLDGTTDLVCGSTWPHHVDGHFKGFFTCLDDLGVSLSHEDRPGRICDVSLNVDPQIKLYQVGVIEDRFIPGIWRVVGCMVIYRYIYGKK